MFVLTLQGLRTYQCGFVIQQRQCSLFRQFPLAMTSSANVELPSAWSKCQCVLMSQRRLMKRRSNCTAYLRGARDIASVDDRRSLTGTYRGYSSASSRQRENIWRNLGHGQRSALVVARDEFRVWEAAREYNMRLDVKPGLHAGG